MKIGKILKISISAILSLALIASIIVIPAVSAETTTDYNLIKNGDFESGTTDWYISSSDKVTVKTTSEYDITDDNHGKVLKATTNWQYAAQDNIAVEPNTTYILKFNYYVKSWFGGQYKVGTKMSDLVATSIYYYAADNKNLTLGKWATITKEITTAENQTTFAFAVAGNGGAIFVDNIVLSKKVTITATAAKGGTVTPESATVVPGDNVTFTATADAGYLFEGWYNGETKVSEVGAYKFTVAGPTALTAKFIAGDAVNPVVNGSFEGSLSSGWGATTFADFKAVNAKDEGISAIDGTRVLKIATVNRWNFNKQTLTLEKGKTYKVSFWVYRPASSDVAIYKLGSSAGDATYVNDRYLNTEGGIASGRWDYVSNTITTTDSEFRITLVAHTGTVYIDDIRIVETDAIGNIIENGDMSNAGKALNAWDNYDANCFSYDAEAESYTGNGALKITGSTSASWANAKYTFRVKANTDYVFRFYAKNAVAGKKSVYKILGADNKTYMFNGKDAYTNGDGANGDGADWGKNEWRFNSGENTTLYLYFVEIDNVTYIDDIYLGEAIAATCASSNKALGTVSASKAYVGEDDEVTYTATATAGGKFLGWRVGGSDTLVEGETYTYKGFDDITITAVFEAALGNVNEDGAIDAADMAALRESILGSAEYTALGDMNANAANDIRDLVALYRAISN